MCYFQESKARFDSDEAFKKRAYERVVQLQNGDKDVRKAWTMICDVSREGVVFLHVYNYIYKIESNMDDVKYVNLTSNISGTRLDWLLKLFRIYVHPLFKYPNTAIFVHTCTCTLL